MKYITVNTDASFDPYEKVCGYAFYIKSSDFLLKVAGKMKERVADPHEAESKCIANALFYLKDHLEKNQIDEKFKLIINTDSKYSISAIEDPKKPLYFLIRNLLSDINLEWYELRHVKAHNGTPDSRSWVNDWCDKQAKKQMYKLREESKKSKGKKKAGTTVKKEANKIGIENIFVCTFAVLNFLFN